MGLLGNPSDGYFGKTISLSIKNFWAEAQIVESEKLELKRHPLNDPTEFGSLSDLYKVRMPPFLCFDGRFARCRPWRVGLLALARLPLIAGHRALRVRYRCTRTIKVDFG